MQMKLDLPHDRHFNDESKCRLIRSTLLNSSLTHKHVLIVKYWEMGA